MGTDRGLSLALGALGVSSGLALLTFDIIFSISVSKKVPVSGVRIVSIVASALEGVAVTVLVVLVGRHIRYRNGAHIQDLGHGKQYTYWLAGIAGLCGVLAAAASAAGFILVKNKVVPGSRALGSSINQLVAGGFVSWAIALVSQIAFAIALVIIQRRDFQQQIKPYRSEIDGQNVNQDMELPSTPEHKTSGYREKTSMDSRTPPSTLGRSRAGSDTVNSIRSSFSQVMRPATSKTKLISKSPYRGASMDSHRETGTSIDGFDSWDTSTVDAQSRHVVESASPTPPRFLETIPASPTGSRSPSPGCPLDLQPPKMRRRSRSFSPSTSYKDLPKLSRATSPESPTHEGHIHPLFRTDSPTPPPAATPNTMVTAAPGAGLIISDRQSIRSLARMRSGSAPSSPLIHSASLDSIRLAMERDERGREREAEVERTLTPPIPDFVMNGTPRSSMQGYARRKTSGRGLNKVGEDIES